MFNEIETLLHQGSDWIVNVLILNQLPTFTVLCERVRRVTFTKVIKKNIEYNHKPQTSYMEHNDVMYLETYAMSNDMHTFRCIFLGEGGDFF